MDDVVDRGEVLDVVEPNDEVVDLPEGDEDAMDVVAADEPRRGTKPRKKGKKTKYRKPIWMQDGGYRSFWLTPEMISTGILIVVGIVFMAVALTIYPTGPKLLFTYGILLQIIGIIWGIMVAANDGEGARALLWVYRWVYCVGNIERGLYPMAIEIAGIIFMIYGWVVY
jgi:hypothetical protein